MIEVLSAGTLATVQDWPGRLGYWEVGVPPSGPMDDRSFRIGNRLLGNPEGAAGLEVTLTGPRLRFAREAVVAVTGAPMTVTLDGEPVQQWQPLTVPAGAVLKLGGIRGVGLRAYLLVQGGIDAAAVMGSRAVFAPARLGGEPLRRGDVLAVGAAAPETPLAAAPETGAFSNEWVLRVVPGPHGAPDFLTHDGMRALLTGGWVVHHHSDRTGVRLVGPAPAWARADGGDAGLHPSNILDSAYGVGTVMLAGDMAVVVGPDGPSLGGFAAVAQVISADLWRLGQVRAGDHVTLQAVHPAHAAELRAVATAQITGETAPPAKSAGAVAPVPVLGVSADGAGGPVTFRRAGERALLVEFGEPVLDLRSRVRAHLLQQALVDEGVPGVVDLTPGVRSLHIHHDPDAITTERLLDVVTGLERELASPDGLVIEGRTVHLPLAWRHSQAMLAVQRYQSSVRADAPWCPDNIEFIRRINGLPDEAAVQAIVLDASYLVLGLGDVYMGAPVAVPLDPRHRLVTTKYNPARTWTPANAVGIGGAFMCVYGMEGPGGYQLVGRTVPIWHHGDEPAWRLRHFDQLRFELVGEDELEELRTRSEEGSWAPRVQAGGFSLAAHEALLQANAAEIERFTQSRQRAFALERDAWAALARDAA